MILSVRHWYFGRSQRERWLIALMLAILLPLLLWLLIYRPVVGALDGAKARHVEAVQRHGRVLAQVEQLRRGVDVAPAAASGAELTLVVGEAATRSGLSLSGNTPQGPDLVSIAIAGAPMTAAMRWLQELEGQGIHARELGIVPQPGGAVAVTATLGRSGR